MAISSRIFAAGQTYKLCAFEVQENNEWAPPDGTQVMHVEPIIEDGVVEGLYLWALVPSDKMAEFREGQHDT